MHRHTGKRGSVRLWRRGGGPVTSTVVVSVLGVAVGWVAHRVRCGWRKGQYVHDVAGAARADGVEYARRVNAAADLAAEGLPAPCPRALWMRTSRHGSVVDAEDEIR